MKKLKVVYWNNIPAPYIVDRFNAVADRGNVDFEGWFSERTHADRSWNVEEDMWRFKYKYIPTKNILGRSFRSPFGLINEVNPDFLISLFHEPDFILGWQYARMKKIKTGFWAQVTMDTWVKRRMHKDLIRRYMFSRVGAVMGSGEDSRQYAMKYGAPAEKAMILRHAVDIDHYHSAHSVTEQRKAELREEIGVKGRVFVYVGRLWDGKGIGVLLEAYKKLLAETNEDSTLIFLGDGVHAEKYKAFCEENNILDNVYFAGYRQKDVVPEYFAISDVFICPSFGDPYCTVIDEAMAASLPIISSTGVGELETRVKEGKNGFIYHYEDMGKLYGILREFAEMDDARLEAMGRESWNEIKPYTLDRWAQDLEEIADIVVSGNYKLPGDMSSKK